VHLAFLVPPASGHVNLTLPLVAELVRRRHPVSSATGAVRASTWRRPFPGSLRV
jgi:hypothetical protein